jgi:hypothetical protein
LSLRLHPIEPLGLKTDVQWDKDNLEDRLSWNVQHGILKFWDPPYVYNVFHDDKQGFVEAVKSALSNPIDRFVALSTG